MRVTRLYKNITLQYLQDTVLVTMEVATYSIPVSC